MVGMHDLPEFHRVEFGLGIPRQFLGTRIHKEYSLLLVDEDCRQGHLRDSPEFGFTFSERNGVPAFPPEQDRPEHNYRHCEGSHREKKERAEKKRERNRKRASHAFTVKLAEYTLRLHLLRVQ